MKRYIFIAAMMIGLFSINSVSAQVHVNVNVNTQPAWGPSGYDYARYYFMPEINVYYDINSGLYIYMNGNHWVKRHALPSRYKKYDLYRTYKVVINSRNPWYKHSQYKKQYAKYGNMHDKQTSLRDSRSHNSQGKSNNSSQKYNQNGSKGGNNKNANNQNHSNSKSSHQTNKQNKH